MSQTYRVKLHSAQQANSAMNAMYQTLKPYLLAEHQYELTVKPASRTLDQNAAQWPYLDAFSKQLKWPVNGALCSLTPEEFKDVLTAAFQGETVRLAMGLNGGVVMLGLRTSKMNKGRFSEWLEFLKATAALRGVTVYEDEAIS